jgi:hypothetical protein
LLQALGLPDFESSRNSSGIGTICWRCQFSMNRPINPGQAGSLDRAGVADECPGFLFNPIRSGGLI